MKTNPQQIIERAMALVLPQFRLDPKGVHGLPHWSRVWTNARRMCEVMGLDPTVPCWFAFTHDSQRENEHSDPSHGVRAADWVGMLANSGQIDLTYQDLLLLQEAVRWHSNGLLQAPPIVQVCWDADRLDLPRVGILPDPRKMCTLAGRGATLTLNHQGETA